MFKQIEEFTDGVTIGKKIPSYLGQLDETREDEKALKKSITNSEISELRSIGLDTIYALKAVHDVPDEVIIRAQGQIGGGLAALAIGIAFPPILPIMGTIAGTLISEGVCDIVMELISQGDSEFNETEYAKGKAISYGISIATMGIGAIASAITTCTKILNTAIKACKVVSEALRKSPFMKTICEKLANQVDKIEKFLEKTLSKVHFEKLSKTERLEHLNKLEKAGEFEKLSHLKGLEKLDELSHLQKCLQVTKNIIISTSKDMAMSIFMEKIIIGGLDKLLEKLKPYLKNKVESTIKDNEQLCIKLKCTEEKTINEAAQRFIEGNIVGNVFKEIALGIMKHSNNWKIKLASLSIESIITGVEIDNCAKNFCETMNTELKLGEEQNDVKQIINQLSEQVSSKIYNLIIGLTSKHVVNLPNIISGAYTSQKVKAKEKEEIKKLQKEHDDKVKNACEKLGVDTDASEAELRKAYRKAALETHPDKNPNNSYAKNDFQAVKDDYEFLIGRKKAKDNLAQNSESEISSNNNTNTTMEDHEANPPPKVTAVHNQGLVPTNNVERDTSIVNTDIDYIEKKSPNPIFWTSPSHGVPKRKATILEGDRYTIPQRGKVPIEQHIEERFSNFEEIADLTQKAKDLGAAITVTSALYQDYKGHVSIVDPTTGTIIPAHDAAHTSGACVICHVPSSNPNSKRIEEIQDQIKNKSSNTNLIPAELNRNQDRIIDKQQIEYLKKINKGTIRHNKDNFSKHVDDIVQQFAKRTSSGTSNPHDTEYSEITEKLSKQYKSNNKQNFYESVARAHNEESKNYIKLQHKKTRNCYDKDASEMQQADTSHLELGEQTLLGDIIES